jgi:hypothetical protein
MHKLAAVLLVVSAVIAGTLSLQGLAQPAATAPAASAPASDVVIKGVSTMPVTFDGNVSKFEYADAACASFPNGHGIVDVSAKCFDGYLYFAFQIPDLSPHPGDDIVIMLDTDHSRHAAPGKTDIRAYVRRNMENSRMQQGDGQKWADYYGDWEYRSALYSTGREVEARIPLKSLGIEPGKKAALGLAFRIWDNKPQQTYNWPAGSNENKPDTWGTLTIDLTE